MKRPGMLSELQIESGDRCDDVRRTSRPELSSSQPCRILGKLLDMGGAIEAAKETFGDFCYQAVPETTT